MSNLHENTDYQPPIGGFICAGTSAVKVLLGLRKQEHVYGITAQDKQLPAIGVDASGIKTTFQVPMIDPSLQHLTLGPNESLSCPLHDNESLQKAEEDGKLWFMPANWHRQPGVAKDNVGSGGNPRTGKALGKLNINKGTKKIRMMLRQLQDYSTQRQIMESADNEKITSAPITIVVCTSLLGGFGSGNTVTILQIIRKLERELKLSIRIVVLGLVLGTLEPTDKLTAARNQEMLLRQLDSCMVGQMEDIQNQSPQRQLLCDSLVLMSNANNHGEIDSIDKVISHVANYVFSLFHSPLGSQVLERCVDIEETWPDDENGGKLWASTSAITKIHLDVPLIIRGVAYKLLNIFFDRILNDQPIKQAAKQAEALCLEQMLNEDGTKNLASQRLTRSDGGGGTNTVEDTIRVFRDRSGGRGGFQGCCDIANASKYTLAVYLQRNVTPVITRQADCTTENVIRSLSNAAAINLQRPDGLIFTRQFLEATASRIKTFSEANAKKLRNAQAKKKSIDDRLSAAHTLVKKLQNRNPIIRFFSFGAKKKCHQIFGLQTEQAIKTTVEIKARVELANDIYPTILESIAKTLQTIQKACENALKMKNQVYSEIRRLEHFSPILQVPVGIELADKAMIQDKYHDTLQAEGGPEKVFDLIFTHFQSLFTDLLAFYHNRSVGSIQKALAEYCAGIGSRRLDHLNIIDALEEYAPGDREKNRLVDQAIRESSGSLRTTGEGGSNIPTIKFIGTGHSHRGLWLEKTANHIDKTDGQWKSVETGDNNTIIFWQQRAQVSIRRLIHWTSSIWQKPKTTREMVRLGACPVTTLAPTSYDNPLQLQSCAAMGLVTGQIQKLDIFNDPYEDTNESKTTVDYDVLIRHLESNLPLRTNIYRQFVINVAINHKKLISSLKNPSQIGNAMYAELIDEIGQPAFDKAAEVAKSLFPHLSRLPKETREYFLKQNGRENRS